MKIFISYSSKNRSLVDSLSSDLGSLGHEVWFDKELSGGQSWWGEIVRNIRECDLFIFALTPDALDSYPCRLEYTYASDLHKHVLPVLLDDVDTNLLPPILSVLQFVDYRNRDADSVIKLSRAFTALPPAQPLPDPLPPEPETPLSPLGKLNERINSLSLDLEEQRALVKELIALLRSSQTFEEAKILLKRLQERKDISEQVADRIEHVLEHTPGGKSLQERLPLHGYGIAVGAGAILAVVVFILLTRGNTSNTPPSNVTAAPTKVPATVIAANAEVLTTPLQTLYGSDTIQNVAFSNDGKYLFAGSADQASAVWEVESGKKLYDFEKAQTVNGTFSNDDKYLLIGSDGIQPRLIEMSTGKEIRRYTEGGNRDTYVTFLSGDKQFVTSSYDNSLRLWDVDSGKMIRQFNGPQIAISSYAVSWDGKYLAAGYQDTTARVWNLDTGDELRNMTGHTGWVTRIAFSPDNKYVLTGAAFEQDNTVRVWEIDKPNAPPVRQFKGAYMGFAANGTMTIISEVSHTASIYSSVLGDQLFEVPAVWIWMPTDGTYVFTVRNDNSAQLYDAASGKKLREYQGNMTWGMLSQDGRWGLTISGNTMQVWSAGVK